MGITLGPGMSALKRLRLGNGDVGMNNGRMPRWWLRHVTRNTDRVPEEEFALEMIFGKIARSLVRKLFFQGYSERPLPNRGHESRPRVLARLIS